MTLSVPGDLLAAAAGGVLGGIAFHILALERLGARPFWGGLAALGLASTAASICYDVGFPAAEHPWSQLIRTGIAAMVGILAAERHVASRASGARRHE